MSDLTNNGSKPSKVIPTILVACMVLSCGFMMIPMVSDESSAATENVMTGSKTVNIGESFSITLQGSTSHSVYMGDYIFDSFTGAPSGVSYSIAETETSSQNRNWYTLVTFSGMTNTPGTHNIELRIHFEYNYATTLVEVYRFTLTVIDPAKTVNFLDTDGSTLAASQQAVTMTLPSANKSGYQFDGWYTSASGGTRVGGAGDSYSPSSNITLYAHWTEIKSNFFANLYFDANGGTGAPTTLSDYIYAAAASGSKTFTIPSTVPTKDYHNFLGWNTNKNASTATYSPGQSISVAYGSDVTLYAVWSVIVPEITSTPGNTHVVVGDSWSYDLRYTPTQGSYISVNGASWLTLSGNTIIGTSSVSGTYDVTVTVTYGSQSDVQEFTLVVVDRLSFESVPTGSILVSPA